MREGGVVNGNTCGRQRRRNGIPTWSAITWGTGAQAGWMRVSQLDNTIALDSVATPLTA